MHIPHHWAEAKVIVTSGESKVTIRRFGWSDTSESDALLHAQRRVNEAAVHWRLCVLPMAGDVGARGDSTLSGEGD